MYLLRYPIASLSYLPINLWFRAGMTMKRIELAALSSYLMRSPFASNVPIWGAACPGFF